LGDFGSAEGCEPAIHGAGLIPVLAVAGPHLPLIRSLLRRLEPGQEIALTLLFDRGAKPNIPAGAESAGLEQLHRLAAPDRGIDGIDDFVSGCGRQEGP
jgi:hypothetical protein